MSIETTTGGNRTLVVVSGRGSTKRCNKYYWLKSFFTSMFLGRSPTVELILDIFVLGSCWGWAFISFMEVLLLAKCKYWKRHLSTVSTASGHKNSWFNDILKWGMGGLFNVKRTIESIL